MNLRICGIVLCVFLVVNCSKHKDQLEKEAGKLSSRSPISTELSFSKVPKGEPSEEVLRKLEFQTYAAIEKMGGIPVTVAATGQSIILHPKLYAVRKNRCTPTPQAPAGWYECELTITVSLSPDGSNPSEQVERIGVKWDLKREWVLQ